MALRVNYRQGEAYGYKKLAAALQRNHSLVINYKKVYQLCRELDILRPQRRIKRNPPKRIAINRTVTAPNKLWEADTKYGYATGENRFFFVMPILDVCDRSVVDFHIGLSCEAADAVRAHCLKGSSLTALINRLFRPIMDHN